METSLASSEKALEIQLDYLETKMLELEQVLKNSQAEISKFIVVLASVKDLES